MISRIFQSDISDMFGLVFRLVDCVVYFVRSVVEVILNPQTELDLIFEVTIWAFLCFIFVSQPKFLQRLRKRNVFALVFLCIVFWPGIIVRYVFEKVVSRLKRRNVYIPYDRLNEYKKRRLQSISDIFFEEDE